MRKRPCAVAAALQPVVAPNTNPAACIQPVGRTPPGQPPFRRRRSLPDRLASGERDVSPFPSDIAPSADDFPTPSDGIRQNRIFNRIKSDSFFAYTEGKCVFLQREKRRYNTQIKTRHIYARPWQRFCGGTAHDRRNPRKGPCGKRRGKADLPSSQLLVIFRRYVDNYYYFYSSENT